MYRANIFNPGTGGLYQIVESTRILVANPPATEGPKWSYELRACGLEFDNATYSAGDVTPRAGSVEEQRVFGYNVWELNNTPNSWFGYQASTYQGLEFGPAPNGAVVFLYFPPFPMVDSSGNPAPKSLQTDQFGLFQWANQLSGACG